MEKTKAELKAELKEQRYSYDALVDQRDNILNALREEEKKNEKLRTTNDELKVNAKSWEDIAAIRAQKIEELEALVESSEEEYDKDLAEKDLLIDKLEGKLHARGSHIEDLQAEIDRLQKENSEIVHSIDESKDKEIEGLYKNAEKQRQELETVISEWKGKALKMQVLVEDAESCAKYWEGVAAGYQEEIKEMKSDWDADREYNEELEGKIGELNSTVTRLESELATANLYIDDVNTKIKQVVKDRKEMSDKRDEALEEYDVMLENRDKILQDFRVLESQNEEIIKTNQKIVKERDELKEEIVRADEFSDKVFFENEELKKANQELTDLVNQTNREKLEAKEEHERLVQDNQIIRDEYARMCEELTSAETVASNLKAQSKLMSEDLADYMQKLQSTQNDLTVKETSLQYFENGLRSAEQEILTLRRTNQNLLNYLNIIASQENPNTQSQF